MINMRRRIMSRTTHCSCMTHQHADATWTQQLQTRRTRRPDVRSPQGRVLLKRKMSTCATESVSYDIEIERSTSQTSERANERANRQGTVAALCLPYSDWGSMWYSCWRSYQAYQRVVFTLTHHHPRKISLVPSRDILSRPHLSLENVAKQTRSPSILPHPPLGGSVRGRL